MADAWIWVGWGIRSTQVVDCQTRGPEGGVELMPAHEKRETVASRPHEADDGRPAPAARVCSFFSTVGLDPGRTIHLIPAHQSKTLHTYTLPDRFQRSECGFGRGGIHNTQRGPAARTDWTAATASRRHVQQPARAWEGLGCPRLRATARPYQALRLPGSLGVLLGGGRLCVQGNNDPSNDTTRTSIRRAVRR